MKKTKRRVVEKEEEMPMHKPKMMMEEREAMMKRKQMYKMDR